MSVNIDSDGVLHQDAMESRADVANLDTLQAKRRQLVKENAPLAAKFKGGSGQGSSADSARKRHRAAIARLILDEQFKGKSGKDVPSETALERMANGDERHIAFCEKLENDFAKFLVNENEIAEITEQIRDREERIRVYRAELGLQ